MSRDEWLALALALLTAVACVVGSRLLALLAAMLGAAVVAVQP